MSPQVKANTLGVANKAPRSLIFPPSLFFLISHHCPLYHSLLGTPVFLLFFDQATLPPTAGPPCLQCSSTWSAPSATPHPPSTPIPGNHQSTLCFYVFVDTGHFISMESHSLCSFVIKYYFQDIK